MCKLTAEYEYKYIISIQYLFLIGLNTRNDPITKFHLEKPRVSHTTLHSYALWLEFPVRGSS